MITPLSAIYIGGIVLGGLIIGAVIYVFVVRKQVGPGALALALIGVALFGLGAWQTLSIDLTRGKLEVLTRNGGDAPQPAKLAESISNPLTFNVALVNNSTSVPDADVAKVAAALRKQLANDVAPKWGVTANITTIPRGGAAPTDAWTISVSDHSDKVGALGYHMVGPNGLPQAWVFAGDAAQAGFPWSVTASHELINMLLDPRANLAVLVQKDNKVSAVYFQEPASPCESVASGYKIDDVALSDFVYPSWFDPNITLASAGAFDRTGQAKAPLALCPGGYISTYEIKDGDWSIKTSV